MFLGCCGHPSFLGDWRQSARRRVDCGEKPFCRCPTAYRSHRLTRAFRAGRTVLGLGQRQPHVCSSRTSRPSWRCNLPWREPFAFQSANPYSNSWLRRLPKASFPASTSPNRATDASPAVWRCTISPVGACAAPARCSPLSAAGTSRTPLSTVPLARQTPGRLLIRLARTRWGCTVVYGCAVAPSVTHAAGARRRRPGNRFREPRLYGKGRTDRPYVAREVSRARVGVYGGARMGARTRMSRQRQTCGNRVPCRSGARTGRSAHPSRPSGGRRMPAARARQ